MFRRRTVPLEFQLQLVPCGIRLNHGFGVEHLLRSFDRQQYESDPYQLLLVMMGSELEAEPFARLSENVWHLDTECIEDHGSYARVAERIGPSRLPHFSSRIFATTSIWRNKRRHYPSSSTARKFSGMPK